MVFSFGGLARKSNRWICYLMFLFYIAEIGSFLLVWWYHFYTYSISIKYTHLLSQYSPDLLRRSQCHTPSGFSFSFTSVRNVYTCTNLKISGMTTIYQRQVSYKDDCIPQIPSTVSIQSKTHKSIHFDDID